MQTFLPYPDFNKSAEVLDYRRLGKQRVEVLQLLKALLGHTSAWVNHPAAKMWKGYEQALVQYGLTICQEWIDRGYNDSCFDKIYDYSTPGYVYDNPTWLGDEEFHASHRSNLLRKDPIWYGKFGWTEDSNLPYMWPTSTVSVNP